jgi:hypothetical protein
MIDDSRESQIRFLQSLPVDIPVELQMITSPPFFDKDIERAIMKFNPALIVLDLLLLEEVDSGFRILRQLKESEYLKEIPVVVISKFIGSDRNDKYRRKSLAFGSVAALPKIPFPKPEEFLKYTKTTDPKP